MKILKFRVWDNAHSWTKPKFWYSYETDKSATFWQWAENHKLENKVQQYIGVQDKNGRDIYEGDIVNVNGRKFEVKFGKVQRDVVGYDGVVRTLEFNTFYFKGIDGLAYFSIVGEIHDLELTEVIGNIYEK